MGNKVVNSKEMYVKDTMCENIFNIQPILVYSECENVLV